MATVQGMCRNCGALIVFDNRDDQCECVFCNCVFPSAEALEIMENPEGRTFPNEKFEPSTENSHHFQTRVYSDESIEKAIKREQLSKANNPEDTVIVKNEYEVLPSDVKAPKNLVIGIAVGVVLAVALVAAIAFPLKKSREDLTGRIESGLADVYNGIITVDTRADSDGYIRGYNIDGQTAQKVKLLTADSVTEGQAIQIFENYCTLRAQERGTSGNIYSGVVVKIYCDGGIYTVEEVKGNITAVYSDDASLETVAPTEEDS
ncbi:MAG: hypothetical protein J5685_12720 [Clostridiales bacterium]|nr:hypothetical protein [Clostridiales bacterium]